MQRQDIFGYSFDPSYQTSVAYFSMEFAIDQALKIYSGGLGFLAGSHLRSAYELRQNLVGIGILWSYGYYDQARDQQGFLKPAYVHKQYSFLEDTGILFTIPVHGAAVHVRAFLLRPEIFGSAPLYLLSTDIPENDYISRTITHRLYDSNERTRIAQSIILGIGGARLLDLLGRKTDVYHMNEGHSLPLNFYLYSKYNSMEEVRRRVVFTTHTPERAGNEEHPIGLLRDMSFFYDLQESEVRSLLQLHGPDLNYTLAALRFARRANAVSRMHGQVSRRMWGGNEGICPITSITNAQNQQYWQDGAFAAALAKEDNQLLQRRKHAMKRALFGIVADQCGKLFDENVLTLVWARRFAAYKRADLLMRYQERFEQLIQNQQYPIQIIWAGKPYPEDSGAIAIFNSLIERCRQLPNCAVLTGYELDLSGKLKKGSDVWLNNPRMYHEASGTSGMSAAMNGSVNLSLPDGWIPEFARHGINSFVVEPGPEQLPPSAKDDLEGLHLINMLEQQVLPTYYEDPERWWSIVRQAAQDVVPAFESGRMARQYYNNLYECAGEPVLLSSRPEHL